MRRFKTYFPLPRPGESFAANHPKLAKSWDYEKNYPLTPECFTSGSNRKVYWSCRKGHSYLQTIHDRRNAVTCPVCYKTRGTGKNYTNKDKRQLKLI